MGNLIKTGFLLVVMTCLLVLIGGAVGGLQGMLAHELSHVKNRDTLIMTIAATLAGAITYLAQMAQWAAIFGGGRRSDEEGEGGGGLIGLLLMAVLAPFAAM